MREHGPERHELPVEPATERVAWVITGAIVALSVLALLTVDRRTDDSANVATGTTTTELANSTIDPAEADDTSRSTGEPSVSERFTISASGDIIVHGRVADAATTESGYDFTPLFANVQGPISSADLAICHLESPLSATNTDLAFGEAGAFRAPNQLADALTEVGFDSCSVASNHAYDSGESSVIATVEQLQRVGLAHVGIATSEEQAAELWQVRVGEVTVGHLAYTYGLNGRAVGEVPTSRVAQIDEAFILADAARHDAAGTDFLVVSMHWGDEFDPELTDLQAELGPRLIASDDIDLLIGHSAHVPQQITEYDGEYVAYGLGNLLSNQSIDAPECPTLCTLESQDGALVEFVVDRRDDGSLGVVDIVARPTWVAVGTTWEIVDTTSVPVTGSEFDRNVLKASFDRTMATLGLSAEVG